MKDAIQAEYEKQKDKKPLAEEVKTQQKAKKEEEKRLAKLEEQKKKDKEILEELSDIEETIRIYIQKHKNKQTPELKTLLLKMKETGIKYNNLTVDNLDIAREYVKIIGK